MAKTVEQVFNKYRSRLTGSTTEMAEGARTTDKSQTKNAIAAKNLMIENHRKAVERGDWEKGLEEAGDEKWQRNYIEKGLPKIGLGIDANEAEIKTKMVKVISTGDRVRSEVARMPKGGNQNALARVQKSMEIQQDSWGKK